MALNNLTNQNIQDTYQKVVQTDGTNLADGTGSLLPISFNGSKTITTGGLDVGGVLDVGGIFKIPGFNNVSSSLAAAVAGGDNLGNHTAVQSINLDGYDIFGIRNITASNNISASGTITTLSASISRINVNVISGENIIGATGSFSQTVITSPYGAENSPFLINIHDHNGPDNKLEMTKDGILRYGALDTLPTAITGGLVYSSSAFYVGL